MKPHTIFLLAICAGLAAVPAVLAQTTFTQITAGPIATDRGSFGGAAWGDFENRGLLDLLVCDYTGGTNVFYRNNGDGSFAKITQRDPVLHAAYQAVPAVADFDNDGYLDLLVTAGVGAPTPQRNMLYHNNGDGTFTPISGGGVTNLVGYFHSCAVADYDNDGFVDLLITNPGPNGNLGPNLLYRNNGDGTFKRVLSGSVVTDIVWDSCVSWADYDNDGFMDLLVNSAGTVPGRNFLYHNNRDGTFTRILTNAVATYMWSIGPWGSAWGDYDNDGVLDLFVTGMESGNRLYHNNRNGVFTNVTSGPMLRPPLGGGSRACAWGDFDNDGYLDLFVSSYNATNRLFHNNGDGTFTQVIGGVFDNEANNGIYCNSCGWADYDNDGFLDLLVTRSSDNGPVSNLLYHNNGNTNAWLEVKLVGSASNRSGIGAKLRAHTTIGGKEFWQFREFSSNGGRYIKPLTAHFGLGDATNVDTLRIEWPSGIVQTVTNVAARQILTVVEHQAFGTISTPSITGVSRSTNGVVNLSAAGDAGQLYMLEASTNLANWTKVGVRSNATGIVEFTDPKATNYTGRFYRVSIP